MSTSKEAESSKSADKVAQANKSEEEAKKTLPQLGALEEDDEFEEFEAEDWDDSEASLTQVSTTIKGKSDSLNTSSTTNGAGAGGNAGAGTGTTGGKTGTGMDNLWEDNWDDDDIEDDFSVQLRKAISEHNNNGPAPMAT